MFFIAGLTTKVRKVGAGAFACPHEQATRRYVHLRQARWLTLFFIPVIPLGGRREWVECEGCGRAYDPGVADRSPATLQ